MPSVKKRKRKNAGGFDTKKLKALREVARADKDRESFADLIMPLLASAEAQANELHDKHVLPLLEHENAPPKAQQILTLALVLEARRLMWVTTQSAPETERMNASAMSETFIFYIKMIDGICTIAEERQRTQPRSNTT